MNRDQIEGGIRNIRGRGRSALGAVTGRVRPQAEGAFDQAAGAVQYAYGRARDAADDLHRDGTQFVEEARHRGRAIADDLQERGRTYQGEAVRRGRVVAARADENKGTTLLLVALAAFGAGWLMRRTR
ncbi:CsbD family protein [Methylobacterium sp. J-068]|uniref:CsbD family protein n=1 Tax=Methylobacterium sp. J-068 TaxID=2836649 RepID=UPI001FBAA2B8|nr:CsbD family protein [Methylobacterium sp. J-068]MCJ2034783.1 CsbD family protein [Methylobacterium sp. J-068]